MSYGNGLNSEQEDTESIHSNETVKTLFRRASCRSFSERAIPRDILRTILEAGTHAPTAGNLQPYSIIKIESFLTRERIATLCKQRFIADAPASLIFCMDLHRLGRWAELGVAPYSATSSFRHFWISFQDTMICAQTICTAADAMGLGSVYIGTVLDIVPKLQEMLLLPKRVFPVVLLCLGYPKGNLMPRNKLGIDVVVHEEKYRELDNSELLQAFDRKYSGQDDRRLPITDDYANTIYKACRKVRGEDFANMCAETIKRNGYINAVQRLFGIHYRADLLPKRNSEYLRIMEESGFDWFKDPEGDR